MIDKILQWMLIPRTIMMGVIVLMSIVLPNIYFTLAVKWWFLAALILLVFAVATPNYLVDKRWERAFFMAPLIMIKSLFNIPTLLSGKKRYINKNK